jgi:hypothetical protein
VKWIDEVLEIALTRKPEPLSEEELVELVKGNEGDKPNSIHTH